VLRRHLEELARGELVLFALEVGEAGGEAQLRAEGGVGGRVGVDSAFVM